jgi:hypothetical protein
MMNFEDLASGLGTTRTKLRLGFGGAIGIITATAAYLFLKASGMPGAEAANHVMMGWWPGTVFLAPLGYDLICKGWSLDHHAPEQGV